MESQHARSQRGGAAAGEELVSLVAFRLGRQMYALPIEPIVRIIEMVALTPLIQVSAAVEGVINVRGQAVPVINLRRLFGLPETVLHLRTPIILVQPADRLYGLIVDEVVDILQVPAKRISRVADILPAGVGEAPVLRGLAHVQNQTVLVLDMDHLLSATHLQALMQAMAELPAPAEESVESALLLPEKPAAEPAVGEASKKRGRRKKGAA